MSRILSLVSLLSLAGTAGTLPQRLKPLLAGAGLPPSIQASLRSAGGARQGEMVASPEMERMLEAALAGSGAMPAKFLESLAPEERQIAAELRPQVEVLTNPLMAKLLQASSSSPSASGAQGADPRLEVARYAALAHRVYEENQDRLIGVLWGAPVSLLALAGLFYVLGVKGASRHFAGACHSLAAKALFLISLGAAVMFLAFKVDLWASLPQDLWTVPVGALIVSGAFLKVVDLNFPIWNSTVTSLMAPIGSCALILGYDRATSLLRGFIA